MKIKKSEEILQIAQRLFASYGLKKTSVDDIASEAKICKATIYYYFKNKQEIFKTVVDREWTILKNAIREAISKEKSPQRKLRAFILTRISRMHELVNLYRVTEDSVTEFLPELEKIRESHSKEEMNIIDEILSEGVEKGIFGTKKIRITSLAMVSVLKGLEYPWVLGGKALNVEKSVDTLLHILLKGIEVK